MTQHVRLDTLEPGRRFYVTDVHGSLLGQVVEPAGRGVHVQLRTGRSRWVDRELAGALLVEPIEEQAS